MKCPSNYGDSHKNCTVCRNGIIPQFAIDFINNHMEDKDDYYLFEINQIANQPLYRNKISFRLIKPTLVIYAVDINLIDDDIIPTNNTVCLIKSILKKMYNITV